MWSGNLMTSINGFPTSLSLHQMEEQLMDRPSVNEMLWFFDQIIKRPEDFNLDPDSGFVDTAKREFNFLYEFHWKRRRMTKRFDAWRVL